MEYNNKELAQMLRSCGLKVVINDLYYDIFKDKHFVGPIEEFRSLAVIVLGLLGKL